MIRAVIFDVDFTLIYPGPVFGAEGYRAFCERHGMTVDVDRFDEALVTGAALLDGRDRPEYDADVYLRYVRHIIGHMGATGEALDPCAREIYDQWAVCRHFELYDDVRPTFEELAAGGIRIGLISNSHRCLDSFQSHFELRGLIGASVSSAVYGMMKPHPSIFTETLSVLNVSPGEAVMVGDNVRDDIEGALRAGMRAVLINRGGDVHPDAAAMAAADVRVVTSLRAVPGLIGAATGVAGGVRDAVREGLHPA
ncbi:MAG: HAD family hydrolase [Vicinamibacterales bacterium]